jgi:CheY-like chemotaxis protein
LILAALASRFEDSAGWQMVRPFVMHTSGSRFAGYSGSLMSDCFTTEEGEEGAGLGLAIVQKIVQNHDGAIQVTGVPGQGSVFSVLFPRHMEMSSSSRLSKTMEISTGDERILFVDDEPQLLEAYKSLLKSLGYAVMACSDSTEAAQLFWLRPHEYDLIVTDQTMPKLSGIT